MPPQSRGRSPPPLCALPDRTCWALPYSDTGRVSSGRPRGQTPCGPPVPKSGADQLGLRKSTWAPPLTLDNSSEVNSTETFLSLLTLLSFAPLDFSVDFTLVMIFPLL